jgi:hypothetical protein
MQLKELALTSPKIAPGAVLQAIENAIPSQEIAQAIKSSQSEQQRKRVLPTHLVVAGASHFCDKQLYLEPKSYHISTFGKIVSILWGSKSQLSA